MWADDRTLRAFNGGFFVTLSFVMLAITLTTGVFIMRAALRYTSGGVILSAAVGGAVNAGFIMLLQNVYSSFTVRLTDWENWETQTQWVDSRAMKTFVFNTVNSFGSFVYIAYVRKEYDSGCMGACEHATFGSAIQTDKCPKVTALLNANDGVWPSNVTFTPDYQEYKGDCDGAMDPASTDIYVKTHRRQHIRNRDTTVHQREKEFEIASRSPSVYREYEKDLGKKIKT